MTSATQSTAAREQTPRAGSANLIAGFHGVRYQSRDVARALADLSSVIRKFKSAGLRFRNELETGPGGKQIQVEDPDGNPVELFEPQRS